MKAVICHKFGDPDYLVYGDTPSPKPGPGQVIISTYAAGVNFPDTLVVQGKAQYRVSVPFSPGAEVAGIIKEVGEGVDHIKVGDRVLAGTVWGSYAEEVVAPAYNTFVIPEEMDFLTASIFLCAYGTAIHALKDRGSLNAGETVAILGAAGGVGLACVQVAKALGAKVIALASTKEKLAMCKKNGADVCVNYSEVDLKEKLKRLTDGRGVDLIVDPVGSEYSEQALRATAWRGRFLVVGFTAGSIAKIPLNLPLLKGCSVTGVFWSTFARKEPQNNTANVALLFDLYKKGKIKPHLYKIFPLSAFRLAHAEISNRKVIGKIALIPK